MDRDVEDGLVVLLGNSRLIATAKAPMSVTADILQDAGHRMSVWVGVMPAALQWLGSTMSGFRR